MPPPVQPAETGLRKGSVAQPSPSKQVAEKELVEMEKRILALIEVGGWVE